jgi:hypothetical protein
MTRTTLIITLAAAAALAGCKPENHTIVAGAPEPDADNTSAPKGPVALPPSIASSQIYRCADNKVLYVDWLSDNKSANIHTEKGGPPTVVTAPEAGKPMTAPGGYSLEGKASGHSAKIGVPGHPSQTCNA